MKTFIAFSCALCLANNIVAGPNEAALRQAREVSAKVTQAEQGNPPATTPAHPAPAQTDPVLAATLRNIANLHTDFAALGNLADTNSADTQKQLLQNDLALAAQGTKPSSASVAKLADDLAKATTGKVKADATHQKLAQNLHAIFNSSHLSPSQQQMIFDDTRKLLQSSGVALEDATNVVNDIQQIAAETK